jgi:tetratricopeptide (TPR) repeat protein
MQLWSIDTFSANPYPLYLKLAQRRFDKAESLFTEALEISRRTLGEDHPFKLTTVNDLATVNKEQAKYQDAEDLLIDAVEGRIQKLGRQYQDTKESLNNLIDLYEAWGKPEKADEWRAKLPQAEAVEQ